MVEVTQEEVFNYLEDLRSTGETNMFGAAPYLMSEFGFDRKEAQDWLKKWMDSYKEG